MDLLESEEGRTNRLLLHVGLAKRTGTLPRPLWSRAVLVGLVVAAVIYGWDAWRTRQATWQADRMAGQYRSAP